MHDKCNCYSRNCYYNCQEGTNSIDATYRDLFSIIIIISIGHRNQGHRINLSLVNSTEEVYIRREEVTKEEVLVSHKEGISTHKSKYKLLRIASHIDFPKVRTFLESVARGSKNSKDLYEIGLKHLQSFLSNSNSFDDRHYDIETILLDLQSNKLNVYEILDSFVSYLANMTHQPPIAPTSIALYVYAVRSYLQYHDIDINPYKFRRRVRLPKVQSTPVPNDIMGLFIKFSKEVGDMTIGAGSQITYEVTSQQDVAVKVSNGQTVPAKLATLTMTLTDSGGEIYQQDKIFALFLVGPDGNTGYSIISPRWTPATTPQAPTEIMQILQSFELVA